MTGPGEERELDLSSYSSEPIEIELAGRRYRGIRFFRGVRELRQEIHYADLHQLDPKPHRPRDVSQMRAIARVILRELVEQERVRGARRPLKVAPTSVTPRSRRAR